MRPLMGAPVLCSRRAASCFRWPGLHQPPLAAFASAAAVCTAVAARCFDRDSHSVHHGVHCCHAPGCKASACIWLLVESVGFGWFEHTGDACVFLHVCRAVPMCSGCAQDGSRQARCRSLLALRHCGAPHFVARSHQHRCNNSMHARPKLDANNSPCVCMHTGLLPRAYGVHRSTALLPAEALGSGTRHQQLTNTRTTTTTAVLENH